jgi:hypothetical protein
LYLRITIIDGNKGAGSMKTYMLTVFAKDGSKLLEESFEAASEKEAKEIGEKKLTEQNYETHTSRVTSPSGKLVLFHR